MAIDKYSEEKIGEWFFQNRGYTPVPLAILMLIYSDPSIRSVLLGALCIVLGESLRIYSIGFVGSISRTRSDSTGSDLINKGPYAFVRNPMYVGNFLLVIGFMIAAKTFWIGILTLGLFYTQYYFIVRYEESILTSKFGSEYHSYLRSVPRWIPFGIPTLEELRWPRDFSPALRSERNTFALITGLLLFLSFA